MSRTADVVICGAGIAGVAAAYYLSKAGLKNILLIDERAPLSLTSDRSTECYRNWWPDPAMLALMNRSIDLMEALAESSGNVFHMNRRGYLYVTAAESNVDAFRERAERTSRLGAGPMRVHSAAADSTYRPSSPDGFADKLGGGDLLLGADVIQKYFPYLTPRACAALHVRRAGWLSAQQLGTLLLGEARSRGVQIETSRVESIRNVAGNIESIKLSSGDDIHAPIFINAAGPKLNEINTMLGIELPVYAELHVKAAIKDSLGVVPRDAPLLILDDAQQLTWADEERAALDAQPETKWLLDRLPGGAHTRPEGSGDSATILMLWEARTLITEPIWPLPIDEMYAEVALRGLSTVLPRLREYFSRLPRAQVDGGYYMRTRENRPLIGPAEIGGSFVLGALSGYGIMAACAAAELLTACVQKENLPGYAAPFDPARYAHPEYLREIEQLTESGQL